MVEFAIVSPLFFALIFGVIDFSLVMFDYLNISNAVRVSARTEAAYANTDDNADYMTLVKLKADSGNVWNSIQQVVIFKGNDTTNQDIPSQCKNGSLYESKEGLCTVYNASNLTEEKFNLEQINAICEGKGWCPADRKATGTTDLLGVYVSFKHTYLSGIIGKSATIRATATARLEPQDTI